MQFNVLRSVACGFQKLVGIADSYHGLSTSYVSLCEGPEDCAEDYEPHMLPIELPSCTRAFGLVIGHWPAVVIYCFTYSSSACSSGKRTRQKSGPILRWCSSPASTPTFEFKTHSSAPVIGKETPICAENFTIASNQLNSSTQPQLSSAEHPTCHRATVCLHTILKSGHMNQYVCL
jgi:hypothetical protein